MSYYVYDIRKQFETFEAIFAEPNDAHEWAEKKLGEHAYVTAKSMGLPKLTSKRKRK